MSQVPAPPLDRSLSVEATISTNPPSCLSLDDDTSAFLNPPSDFDSSSTGLGAEVDSQTLSSVSSFDNTKPTSLTPNWHQTMPIPLRFSKSTNQCIDSGVLNGAARDEIITYLSTHMLCYTTQPLPSQYTTVCQRLVEAIPALKDGIGSGYVGHIIFSFTYIV